MTDTRQQDEDIAARLRDEADQCRNDGADDIARLLDEAAAALAAPQAEPVSATYDKPPHGWTCFHCGETFTTVGSARDHFGATEAAEPGCMVRVSFGAERGLLMALRKAEEELATIYRERGEDDTLMHRELYRLKSKHSDSLRVAEEAGYERGLRDAKAENAPPAPNEPLQAR